MQALLALRLSLLLALLLPVAGCVDSEVPRLYRTAHISATVQDRLRDALSSNEDWTPSPGWPYSAWPYPGPQSDDAFAYVFREDALAIHAGLEADGRRIRLVVYDFGWEGREHVVRAFESEFERAYEGLRRECSDLPQWRTMVVEWIPVSDWRPRLLRVIRLLAAVALGAALVVYAIYAWNRRRSARSS